MLRSTRLWKISDTDTDLYRKEQKTQPNPPWIKPNEVNRKTLTDCTGPGCHSLGKRGNPSLVTFTNPSYSMYS